VHYGEPEPTSPTLDDGVPVGPGMYQAGKVKPPRPKRGKGSRRRQILKWTGLSLAALLLIAIGLGTYAYVTIDGNIKTFSEAGVSKDRPAQTPGTNILIIGSDSRGDGGAALGGGSDVTGARSDTTMLLHVYPGGSHAVVVSIPRDTLLDIPSCLQPDGRWSDPQQDAIFNSAFAVGNSSAGNPVCTQNTVEALTGLRVDHTVVIDFEGFAGMTNAIGGVTVCVPNNVDSYGINLTAGTHNLKGQDALNYVRARHGLGDGSDLARMTRQQSFMSSLAKKVLDGGVMDNPFELYSFTNATVKSITVDPGLGSAAKMLGLAWDLRNLSMSRITFVTMPYVLDGARVKPMQPDTDELWQLLKNNTVLSTGSSSAAGVSSSPDTAPQAAAAGGDAPSRLAAWEVPASVAMSGSTPLPPGITQNMRPANTDLCKGLTNDH
jgi:LCP family protein required for cell wall assembly